MSITRGLLGAGVATPFLYFGTLAIGAWLTPDYSHVNRYASELGMADAPAASLFNGGILLTAVATIAASLGLYRATARVGSTGLWLALATLALGLFGVGLVFGALFPMPDPRHGGLGLGMAVQAAPLFLALALRGEADLVSLKRFLLVATAVSLGLFLIMMGVGSLVTRANVGVFQRVYALSLFGWVAAASFVLLRRWTARDLG